MSIRLSIICSCCYRFLTLLDDFHVERSCTECFPFFTSVLGIPLWPWIDGLMWLTLQQTIWGVEQSPLCMSFDSVSEHDFASSNRHSLI